MGLAAIASMGQRSQHGFSFVNEKTQAHSLVLTSINQYKLTKLWEKTTDPQVNHDGWEYKKQVIDTAMSLFHTQSQTLMSALRVRSVVMQPSHYEFIHDCCRFLETGQRTMSINHWNTVLTYEEWPEREFVDDSVRQRQQRLALMDRRLKVVHPQHGPLVSQWCKQPGGYVDLAFTLKILYLAEVR